jgi:hypothetical protein
MLKPLLYNDGHLQYAIHVKYTGYISEVRSGSTVLPSIDALSERKVAVTGVPFIAQISLRKKKHCFLYKISPRIHRNTAKKDFHFNNVVFFIAVNRFLLLRNPEN